MRLTEVEAYAGTGEDPASHAQRGPTPRNEVMFGSAGNIYLYFVFGMHWCMNIVCGHEGEAAAVLLRAGEVTEGIEVARERRNHAPDSYLARGPALVASGPRVGVTAAHDIPWRFWLVGEPSVSPYRRHTPRRRPTYTVIV